MVVYTPTDSEYERTAARIADHRDEPVTNSLPEALAADGAVVYVSHPSEIAESDLLQLQQRLLSAGPEDGAFSIVTGYTAELAAELYFEDDRPAESNALFFRHDPVQVPDGPDTVASTGNDVTAGAVRELTDSRLQSFGVEAGGYPIHITLSDGYICGFPETRNVENYPDPQPFCVEDGERDCPLSDDLVPAEEIDAAHAFVMSCASLIDNGTSGLPVHVGMGLLDGADSLVGSYRVAASLPHELLFHHSLLLAGYDLNERCYVLNRNSHVNDIMGYPYVGFGRPTAGISSPAPQQYEYAVESGPDPVVAFRDVDADVLDVRLPYDEVPATDDRYYVRNRSDTEDAVLYTVFPEDEGLRLLAYTGNRIRADELRLELSPHRESHVQREIAIDSARNLASALELGLLTTEAKEQYVELMGQIRKFPEKTARERFDAEAHASVEQSLGSLHGQLTAIREELLEMLRERSNYLYFEYGNYVVDDDTYPSDQLCSICGERRTFIKQLSGWTGRSKRLLCNCPRCGHVFEIPASGRTTDPEYPLIVAHPTDEEESRRVTVEFTNPSDAPVQATFEPLILHADNDETAYFDPRREDAVVAPGETHTAEFTVDTGRLPDNTYFLLGRVVANLEIHTGVTVMLVGEDTGYYPPYLR